MRRLLVLFWGKIIVANASYDWFDLYDSRTENLENLDLIPNYKSVHGDFWYKYDSLYYSTDQIF